MAKTTNCAMCGKEIQKGFFSSESFALSVGGELVTVCEDCYNHYDPLEKVHKKRFTTKLNAMRYAAHTKPSKAEIAKLYQKYLQEAEQYAPKSEGAEAVYIIGGFAKVTEDGRFSVMEASNDLLGSDIGAGDMVKTLDASGKAEEIWFTKDDITKIEFAYNDRGDFLGFFNKAYSYTIRLNDEKVMTYRPAITRAAALGKGFFLGYRKNADKVMVENLEEFRRAIGSTLPITFGSKR